MGKKLCILKKDKLCVYEVKTSLKFYKIKEEILKGQLEHVNGIHNFNLDKFDYYSNNEEVKIDNDYIFIEEKEILRVGNNLKMYYKGFKYPDILNVALALRDGDINNVERLNVFRAPQYIKEMKDCKKKRKLLDNYPYDRYVDAIMSCFTLKKIKAATYCNMEDLVKKIEDFTKYNNHLDCGDEAIFSIAKKAELSMFNLDDYSQKNSGISRFKQMLMEHEKIYSLFRSI